MWVKLHDGFYENRKIRSVGLGARWCWIAGLAWSNRNDRDGYVEPWALPSIDATRRHASALVAAGLWLPDGDGWRIHDYAQYQKPDKDPAKVAAGSKGADARWHRDGRGRTAANGT